MTPERVQDLLDGTTPGPWEPGQRLTHKDFLLSVAAPEIAAAYLQLAAEVEELREAMHDVDHWYQAKDKK